MRSPKPLSSLSQANRSGPPSLRGLRVSMKRFVSLGINRPFDGLGKRGGSAGKQTAANSIHLWKRRVTDNAPCFKGKVTAGKHGEAAEKAGGHRDTVGGTRSSPAAD